MWRQPPLPFLFFEYSKPFAAERAHKWVSSAAGENHPPLSFEHLRGPAAGRGREDLSGDPAVVPDNWRLIDQGALTLATPGLVLTMLHTFPPLILKQLRAGSIIAPNLR